MPLEFQNVPVSYFVLLTILAWVIFTIVRGRISALDNIPGPFLARYTDGLRAFMAWRSGKEGENLYTQLHRKYGDIVRLGPRSVSVLDPEAIPLIYGVKAKLSRGHSVDSFTVPGLPPSILGILDGATHARFRRPIQGAYSLTSLKNFEPAVDETLTTLLENFDRFDRERKVINISLWVYYWSYDVVGKVTFGFPMGYMEKAADFNGLIKSQRGFRSYTNVVSQMPSLHNLFANNPLFKLLPKNTDGFVAVAETQVNERLAKYKTTDVPSHDLLSHFIKLRETYPDIVDNDQVFRYALTNVIAGSLSTSLVLDEIVKFLVANPDSQSRIHNDIKAFRSGTDKLAPEVPFDIAKKSPYLEGVMQEGFRLHSTGNLSSDREVSAAGLVLPSGHQLPPGTYVEVNPSIVQQRVDIYGENPKVFDPTRWLQKSDETVEAFTERRTAMDRASLSFGWGSRVCLGKNMVQLKLFKLLSTICERYTLEGEGKPELFTVWTRIKLREKTF